MTYLRDEEIPGVEVGQRTAGALMQTDLLTLKKQLTGSNRKDVGGHSMIRHGQVDKLYRADRIATLALDGKRSWSHFFFFSL